MALPTASFPDLSGRGVLITGGASGIGAALVEGFAAQGAHVGFIDIDAAAGEALAEKWATGRGRAPVFFHADLRDIEALRDAVSKAHTLLGPIACLINNAARDDRHDLDALGQAEWDDSQSINLRPHFFMAQAVAPQMRARGGGSIINFSSIAYMMNMGELPAYSAAKAGIVGLTKSLAGRLGGDNIRVNAVLPGMVVTERQKALWLTDETMAAMVERQCLKHILTATDLVGPCLYLASDCSARMTAQAMIIDGGVF